MEFEYDLKKAQMNLEKHGISFEEAKILWTVPSITLMAQNQDKIRLISVRRSREKEIKEYQRRVQVYEKKEEDYSS